jgi:type IV pilus assembly protein PilF
MTRWMSLAAVSLLSLTVAGCATTRAERLPPQQRIEAAEANTKLGIEYLQRGELQQALRKLQKAIEQNPESANAHMVAGVVYGRLDEPEQAEYHLERAVELEPDNSPALNNYARLLCERGQTGRAVELFEKAAANPLYESPAVPLTNAGLCVLREGDLERAEALFSRALRNNPQFPPALLRMAEIRYRQEAFLSARGFLQRLESVSPPGPAIAWLGLRIEHELGDADAAASYRLLLTSRYPESEESAEMLQWERDGRL